MASIFTQIMAGHIPGHFVYQDDCVVAILTIEPISAGHVLVIPREPINYWEDLPELTAIRLMQVAQKIAKALKQHYQCERVALVVAGFEVPHTHLHVFPVNSMAEMDFARAQAAPHDELARIATLLSTTVAE